MREAIIERPPRSASSPPDGTNISMKNIITAMPMKMNAQRIGDELCAAVACASSVIMG
jgi:hypothetical protein